METYIKRIPIELAMAIVIALVALGITMFFYHGGAPSGNSVVWIFRYFSFGNPYFLWFILFIFALFLKDFYVAAGRLFISSILYHKPIRRSDIKRILYCLWYPLYLLAPLTIASGPISSLLANISYQSRSNTLDGFLLGLDVKLFGTSPFIVLPTILAGQTVTTLLKGAYFSLSIGASAMLALLYLKNTAVFRLAVTSFLMSIIIAYPLFYLVPCQTPAHVFINHTDGNQRNTLTPYTASQSIKDIMLSIEKQETFVMNNEQIVPVSCFPSMHTVATLMSVYFLAIVMPWSLFITVPWGFLALTGGLYFAQHYFVDYIIAVPVTLVSVVLADQLLRWERRWKTSYP